ncbi:Aminopeptidase [Aphelenchoides besseyi]|nr:Aminopeptidase [Aphelenchoides besseyi]
MLKNGHDTDIFISQDHTSTNAATRPQFTCRKHFGCLAAFILAFGGLAIVFVIFVLLQDTNKQIVNNRVRSPGFNFFSLFSHSDGHFDLPRICQVLRYDIQLEPHYPGKLNFTFDGRLKITLSMTNNSDFIQLFAVNLNIIDFWIQSNEGVITRNLDLIHDTTRGLLTVFIRHTSFLANQTYALLFEYTGQMNTNLRSGMITNEYSNAANETKYLIGTDLQPDGARHLMPCFDTSHFKANFQLTLIHARNTRVYNNMPIEHQHAMNKEKLITRFAQTPKMSTYLFSFALGELVDFETKSKSGVPIRAIALRHTPGLKYWSEVAAQFLDYMEEYTGIAYALPKLDLLDIEMKPQGMENYGLITCHRVLTANPTRITRRLHWKIRVLLAHEVSHMWFGDLVTNDEWSNLVLHEGFAQHLQTLLLRKTFPADVHNTDLYVNNDRARGLNSARKLNRSLVLSVNRYHPDEFTYTAGASVLRMLEAAYGADKFRRGIQIFLSENQYQTVDYEHLIRAFEKSLENSLLCVSVREFVEDWFLQSAFPTVEVRANRTTWLYEFKQQPSHWSIPLFAWNQNENMSNWWLLKNGSTCYQSTSTVEIRSMRYDPNRPTFFNFNGLAFAQFYYADELLTQLMTIPSSQWTQTTQFAVLTDYQKLTTIFKDLLKKFVTEADGNVSLYMAAKYIDLVDRESTKTDPITNKLYSQLTWQPQTNDQKDLNEHLLTRAISQNYRDFQPRALREYDRFMRKCRNSTNMYECNPILPSNRGSVYCAVLHSNRTDQKVFHNQYKLQLVAFLSTNSYSTAEIDSFLECGK